MTDVEVKEVLEVLGETFGTTADGLIAEIVRASITRDVVWLVLGAVIISAIVIFAVWFIKKHGCECVSMYEGTILVVGAMTCAIFFAWIATFIDLIRWLISPRGEAILFVINNMGG